MCAVRSERRTQRNFLFKCKFNGYLNIFHRILKYRIWCGIDYLMPLFTPSSHTYISNCVFPTQTHLMAFVRNRFVSVFVGISFYQSRWKCEQITDGNAISISHFLPHEWIGYIAINRISSIKTMNCCAMMQWNVYVIFYISIRFIPETILRRNYCNKFNAKQ